MGKSYLKIKLQEKKKIMALVGYILPFSFSAVLTLIFSLPLIYFTNYSGEITARTSIFARMFENFSAAREALLDTSAEDAVYLSFSSLTMSLFVVLSLLYLIGLFASLIYMITGLRHIYSSDKNSQMRRLFVTVVPNKAVMLALALLSAAPALFPTLLVALIDRVLMVYAKAHYTFGHPLIYCAALWCITVAFFMLTKKYNSDELNVFARQKRKELPKDETDSESEDEKDEAASSVYRMTRLSKEEQAENIRKLLNKNKDDNE